MGSHGGGPCDMRVHVRHVCCAQGWPQGLQWCTRGSCVQVDLLQKQHGPALKQALQGLGGVAADTDKPEAVGAACAQLVQAASQRHTEAQRAADTVRQQLLSAQASLRGLEETISKVPTSLTSPCCRACMRCTASPTRTGSSQHWMGPVAHAAATGCGWTAWPAMLIRATTARRRPVRAVLFGCEEEGGAAGRRREREGSRRGDTGAGQEPRGASGALCGRGRGGGGPREGVLGGGRCGAAGALQQGPGAASHDSSLPLHHSHPASTAHAPACF